MKNIAKKIREKILYISTFFLTILISLQTRVMAKGIDIKTDIYNPHASNGVSGASQLASKAQVIIGTLQVLGTIASVAALIIIGIKYMYGSVEEKAENLQQNSLFCLTDTTKKAPFIVAPKAASCTSFVGWRFGISIVFTVSAIWPNVSTPTSPNASESGIAPMSRKSRTMTKTWLQGGIL